MMPLPYRVRQVTSEMADTFTLDLEAMDGSIDFAFAPGQFNMLYHFGAGEVPISISGDPSINHTLTHTVRAVGVVTNSLQQLQSGAVVGIRGPFGTGWPLDIADGADIVIVAGGIGLAPLRPVIYQVLANRRRYGAICIFYGARTPDEILYRTQLGQWRGRFDVKVDVTVDLAGQDWGGNVGVVTKMLGNRRFDPDATVAFACGPEIMLRYAVFTLNDLGVANDHIYVSMERNMKCAVGFCGHCQFGASFVCKDGPVFRFDKIAEHFNIREL